MKKTLKVFTLTQKRTAIRDMKALVAKGNSVSRARLLIGRVLGVTPNTIYNWERKLTGKSTKSKVMNRTMKTPISVPRVSTIVHKTSNNIAKPHITGVNLHVPGKGNITLDHELLTNISRLAGFTS